MKESLVAKGKLDRQVSSIARDSQSPPSGNYPTPISKLKLGDLLATLICAVAAGSSIWLFPAEPQGALVTGVFFGSGALFLGWIQWRRFSDHKYQFATVDVPIGVPIRQKSGWAVIISVWLVGAGAIFYFNGDAISVFSVWLGAAFVALGCILFVLLALGAAAPQHLQFEDDGLVITERGYRMTLAWRDVRDVQYGDVGGHVSIELYLPKAYLMLIEPVSSLHETLHREPRVFSMWRTVGRCTILPISYGYPPALIANAIVGYIGGANGERKKNAPFD